MDRQSPFKGGCLTEAQPVKIIIFFTEAFRYLYLIFFDEIYFTQNVLVEICWFPGSFPENFEFKILVWYHFWEAEFPRRLTFQSFSSKIIQGSENTRKSVEFDVYTTKNSSIQLFCHSYIQGMSQHYPPQTRRVTF